MLISPEFFRLLVVGDSHAVTLSPFIPAPLELADDEIGLHLQLCDTAVEVLITLFAESRCRLQLEARMHAAVLADIHDRLIPALDQLVVPRRIEVIAVPSGICKVREPFPGNEARLVVKELPVCHLAGRRNDLAPFLGILFGIARQRSKGPLDLLPAC